MPPSRLLCGWLVFVSSLLWAETQPCPAPPPLQAPVERNMFSPQQEMDLGDAIAEQSQHELHIVTDDRLNAYVQQVGDRLLRQLPVPNGLRVRIVLIDLPVANAFTAPGGRIYISRKLALFVRSEDELAAVLAHELGHALTRQPAADMSARFRKTLGVSEVGDRDDIVNKWHQFVETWRVKPAKVDSEHGEREQLIADQVALYALADAGYSPQAFVDFWDRFAETGGKAGGWLSDLFGTTKPEQKRLREARRSLSLLPATCLRASASTEVFREWQTAVNNYSQQTIVRESLPGLIWKRTLHPPLQSDLSQVRFSPDGRYLLAQDDSTVYVLSRQPLSWLFSIDAPDAEPAQFTPDSQTVVFATEGQRVERWEVESRRHTATQELVAREGCIQSLLGPDGKTLVCLTRELDLQLLDASSGERVFEKKQFFTPTLSETFQLYISLARGARPRPLLALAFSPDAQYLIATHGYAAAIALDVPKRTPISLPVHVRELTSHYFTFLGPDRIVGVNFDRPEKSEVVSFPDGRTISKVAMGRQRVSAATHGDYVILRPLQDYAVGVVDLNTSAPVLGSKEPTLDIYDAVYAHAEMDGSLSIVDLATRRPLANVRLPASRLGRVRATSLSSDLHWLAVSGGSRGAVWNLETGDRIFHVRHFNGAWFDARDVLFADFPPTNRMQEEKAERSVGLLDPIRGEASSGGKIEEETTLQFGELLVSTKSEKHSWPPRDADLEVRTIEDRKLVWSAHFDQEQPALWGFPVADRLVYSWPASSKAAKKAMEGNAALKAQIANSKEKEFDWFLEVHELRSGKPLGQILVMTGKGSFRGVGIVAAGNWLVVSDNENRVLVYAVGEAQPRRRFFGHNPALTNSGLLVLENEPGQVNIYDVVSGEKRQELAFPAPLAVSRFCADGRELLAVTSTQTAYLLDVSAAQPASARQ